MQSYEKKKREQKVKLREMIQDTGIKTLYPNLL